MRWRSRRRNPGDLGIDVVPTSGGTRVAFPVAFPSDEAFKRSFKGAFPDAEYDRYRLRWDIAGEDAAARAEAWVQERQAEADLAKQARNGARRARMDEQRAALRENPIRSRAVRSYRNGYYVECAYSARATALVQAISGAARRAHADTWTVPLLAAEHLRAVLPAIEAEYGKVEAFRAACGQGWAEAPDELRVATNKIVTVLEHQFAVMVPYSEAGVGLIRTVPGARWRASLRCWLVPLAEWRHLLVVLPRIAAERGMRR